MKRTLITLLSLGVAGQIGCASKLELKDGEDDGSSRPALEGEVTSGKFTSRPGEGEAVIDTSVDATVTGEWQRLDLDSGESTDDDAKWDLEFMRQLVRLNGGASGEGGVEAASLDGQAFDDVSEAGDAEFSSDAEDGDDGNMDVDNVFNGPDKTWYDYNVMTHVLTPRDATYLVRSSEGRLYKLHYQDYYDEAGTSGFARFLWAELE